MLPRSRDKAEDSLASEARSRPESGVEEDAEKFGKYRLVFHAAKEDADGQTIDAVELSITRCLCL